jgi:hypothetical protein
MEVNVFNESGICATAVETLNQKMMLAILYDTFIGMCLSVKKKKPMNFMS